MSPRLFCPMVSCLVLGASLAAQTKPLPTKPKPADETGAAAKALKKLLDGKGDGTKTDPKQDPKTDPKRDPKTDPKQDPKTDPKQDPKTDPKTGDPQQKKPVKPLPGPDQPPDPAQSAADALKRRSPGAVRVPGDPERGAAAVGLDENNRPTGEPRGLPEAQGAAAVQGLPDPGFPIRGDLWLRYRYRDAGNDDRTQDLRGALSLDFGDRERHPVTGRFYGTGWLDLDGRQLDNVFNGLMETFDEVDGLVYEAHADVHAVPGLQTLRLGRQTLYDTPVVQYLDGLRLESEELTDSALVFGGYVGVPARFYESASGDLSGGIYAGAQPWRRGRVRLDWMHLDDRTPRGDITDDVLAVALWQGLGDLDLHARYAVLDDDSLDLLARLGSYWDDAELRWQLSYYQSFQTLFQLALDIDPFSASAFQYFPYWQVSGLVSKGFGEAVTIDTGFDVRRLRDSDREAQFNREYERVYLTPSWHGSGVSFGLTADYWDSGGEQTLAAGADLTFDIDDEWSAAIGTGYSRFDYDTFSRSERDHVRTVFVRMDYEAAQSVWFDVDYRYQRDDDEDYHALRIGTRWRF